MNRTGTWRSAACEDLVERASAVRLSSVGDRHDLDLAHDRRKPADVVAVERSCALPFSSAYRAGARPGAVTLEREDGDSRHAYQHNGGDHTTHLHMT